MMVISPNLFIVLEKFPGKKHPISKLFGEDETFQSVCEDYRNCTEALRYWNHSDSKESRARRVEYGELLRDLEAEIMEYLNKYAEKGEL